MYDPVSILLHEELKQGFFCLVCNELFYNFTYAFEKRDLIKFVERSHHWLLPYYEKFFMKIS